MDVLSDILDTVRLRGTVYFQSDFTAPWGMTMDGGDVAQFHIVVQGRCWLFTDSLRDPIPLDYGDIVVFPHGDAHWLAASPDAVCVPGKQVLSAYHNGQPMFRDGDVCTTLVCGHFAFERQTQHPFLRDLPPLIHIPGNQQAGTPWLEQTARLIISETDSQQPGAHVIVDRLAEVLFIHVLRAYLLRAEMADSNLTALNDPEISKALQLIHAEPEFDWTLAGIAYQVGLSRASFATRFREKVGMTPMRYITGWRMQKACQLLQDTNLPLTAISQRVGYTSEAAFSRAFKREFDQNPGAWRRTATENGHHQ